MEGGQRKEEGRRGRGEEGRKGGGKEGQGRRGEVSFEYPVTKNYSLTYPYYSCRLTIDLE